MMRWILTVFLVFASTVWAAPWPGERWPDQGGGGFSSGSDIDPANILFAEDTVDSVNNITAFSGDPLTITTTSANINLTAATSGDIVMTTAGTAGNDITAALGGASNFNFSTGSTTSGMNFQLVGTDILQIRQAFGGIAQLISAFAPGSTVGFFIDKTNAANAGVAHTQYRNGTTEVARVGHVGNWINVPGTTTVATSGDGNPATATIECYRRSHQITCNDADSCDITVGETSMVNGQICTFVCMSASPNTCDITDSPGVSVLQGNWPGDQYDTLSLLYTVNQWIEIGRTDASL